MYTSLVSRRLFLYLLLQKSVVHSFKSKLILYVHIVFDGTYTRMFFISWDIWFSDIFGYISKYFF